MHRPTDRTRRRALALLLPLLLLPTLLLPVGAFAQARWFNLAGGAMAAALFVWERARRARTEAPGAPAPAAAAPTPAPAART